MKSRIGREAEGRYRGVKTLYVHDRYVPGSGCQHVYFNPTYLQVNGYGLVQRLMNTKLVTICVVPDMLPGVPADVLSMCHVVVALPVQHDLREYLKGGDEIRLDYQYLENSMFTWGTSTHATRSDYLNDVILDEPGIAPLQKERE